MGTLMRAITVVPISIQVVEVPNGGTLKRILVRVPTMRIISGHPLDRAAWTAVGFSLKL
jgi:hypothetical protein